MNRSQRFIFCVPVLVVAAALALVHASFAGDEWQPITPADLALKDNPASPGANAMILYRQSDVNEKYVYSDGSAIYEYRRIKIFTKQGVESANVEIPFFKDVSDIKDLKGRTIHSDGTIINFEGKPFEKTIFKNSGDRYLAKTFTLPDAQPCSIIEYRYRHQYRPGLLASVESWVLSSELYTREGHFSIVPFDSAYSNYPLYFRLYGLATSTPPEKTMDGNYKLTVHDVPGIEDEAYMPPLRTLESRVVFFHRGNGNWENETPDRFWKDTEKGWNDDVEHFVGKKNSLATEVGKTVSPSDSAEVKLRKLYERTQQIRNLDSEEEKTHDEQKSEEIKKNGNAEETLSHGYASEHQINEVYAALVRAAGYEANLAYVAPRTGMEFNPAIEDPGELASDIVWVRADGKEYYVDPGAADYPFNVLPWYETKTTGLRVSGKTDDKITVPAPTSTDATIVRHADLAIADDGGATGTISIDFNGQEAGIRRHKNHADDDTGRRKAIEEELKGWLPGDASVEVTKLDNWDKNELPLHVEASVKLPSFASVAGHRILVPASFFEAPEIKAFQPAVRHNDISFRYPWEQIDDLKYTAPAGYKIETVPGKVATNPASIVVYQISTSQQGSTAEVQRHLTINAITVEKQYYGALRNFFNGMKTSDDKQIVLQNAESAQK